SRYQDPTGRRICGGRTPLCLWFVGDQRNKFRLYYRRLPAVRQRLRGQQHQPQLPVIVCRVCLQCFQPQKTEARKMRFLYVIILMLSLVACRETEEAKPMARSTFAKFYEGAVSQSGVAARPNDDGYVVLGSRLTSNDTTGLLIRTDMRGEVLWTSELYGIIPKSLQIGQDGFFILGDSIHVNPESEDLDDLIVHSALLYRVGFSGAPEGKLVIADHAAVNKIDYKANAIAIKDQNEIIALGTFREPGLNKTERPFIAALNS